MRPTATSRRVMRRSPTVAASVAKAAATTAALYAGLVVTSAITTHAPLHAATARAFTVSRPLWQRGRGWRRVGGVAPPERFLVVKRDLRVAGLGFRPGAPVVDEKHPVGPVVGKALAELLGLVVDLADGLAKAEGLGLVLDSRLVHQGLAVDRVAAESHALLERSPGRREVLDDDIRVMRCRRVDARAGRACAACAWCRAACCGSGGEQGQYRAGRDCVLAHFVPPGGPPSPHAPHESRPPGASVPLRADGIAVSGIQVSWLADRRLRPAFPRPCASVARVGRRLLAHSCAT